MSLCVFIWELLNGLKKIPTILFSTECFLGQKSSLRWFWTQDMLSGLPAYVSTSICMQTFCTLMNWNLQKSLFQTGTFKIFKGVADNGAPASFNREAVETQTKWGANRFGDENSAVWVEYRVRRGNWLLDGSQGSCSTKGKYWEH